MVREMRHIFLLRERAKGNHAIHLDQHIQVGHQSSGGQKAAMENSNAPLTSNRSESLPISALHKLGPQIEKLRHDFTALPEFPIVIR